MFVRTLFTAAAVAASLIGTTGPALAARDICNGVYEIDGCSYCSYQGGLDGRSPTSCDGGYFGYYWVGCSDWVYNYCVTGALESVE